MGDRKLAYIAGPITGVDRYWEAFERAQDDLAALGYTALMPTWQPKGLTYAQYMRICMAMIDICDAVVLLPGWEQSRGAAGSSAGTQDRRQLPVLYGEPVQAYGGGCKRWTRLTTRAERTHC